jgi:hypothetical protein
VSGGDRSQANAALIAALLSGLTIAQAAEQAGISEPTARRRLKDDAFREQLAEARAELIDTTVARLAWTSGMAVYALADVARNGRNEAARVSAARAILELTLRRRELGSVSGAELERLISTVIGLAIDRLAADEAPAFLREVQALVGP